MEDNVERLDYFYNDRGLKIKFTKRCELCVFSHIDLITDDLVCEKKLYDFTSDNGLCKEFKLNKQMRKDMIDGCINAIQKQLDDGVL